MNQIIKDVCSWSQYALQSMKRYMCIGIYRPFLDDGVDEVVVGNPRAQDLLRMYREAVYQGKGMAAFSYLTALYQEVSA